MGLQITADVANNYQVQRYFLIFYRHIYLPAELEGAFTPNDLAEKPWSQAACLLPGTCLPLYRAQA